MTLFRHAFRINNLFYYADNFTVPLLLVLGLPLPVPNPSILEKCNVHNRFFHFRGDYGNDGGWEWAQAIREGLAGNEFKNNNKTN